MNLYLGQSWKRANEEFFMIIGLENDTVILSGFTTLRNMIEDPPLTLEISELQDFLENEAPEYIQVK